MITKNHARFACSLPVWGFLASPLCAATVPMTGATGSSWNALTTWQDAAVPAATNDYTVNSLTLAAPSLTTTAATSFDGRSLSITDGGLSFPGSSGGTVTHTAAR